MLRTFIQVTAITLTLAASFFLLKGNLSLSASHIAELSKTRWDYNKPVLESLSQQQADTKVGFGFLLTAFIFQLGNLLWPMRWDDFKVSKRGMVVALVVSIALLGLGLVFSRMLTQKIGKTALAVLDQR